MKQTPASGTQARALTGKLHLEPHPEGGAYDPEARALTRHVLGSTSEDHERVAVIRKGIWQAARSLGDLSLVGCCVAPGFEFEDFRFVASLSGHRVHFDSELAPFTSLL